ncbi:hypothetical protein PR202_ga08024 [Eleusine coracana subsp. coracana]|uniref:Uncharacterized protein n=1 Tax=Eleusine coracana subsp. coracana TaxID=191504 RepID=A0AAV5C1F3_ELECO|nr:hypothetical protein PR202_ga08024 [Eleusine coracana subsp. coracana]
MNSSKDESAARCRSFSSNFLKSLRGFRPHLMSLGLTILKCSQHKSGSARGSS